MYPPKHNCYEFLNSSVLVALTWSSTRSVSLWGVREQVRPCYSKFSLRELIIFSNKTQAHYLCQFVALIGSSLALRWGDRTFKRVCDFRSLLFSVTLVYLSPLVKLRRVLQEPSIVRDSQPVYYREFKSHIYSLWLFKINPWMFGSRSIILLNIILFSN